MNRNRESGFALLLIFLMAAGVAIMLYQQLPRTAFESMRAKEEMLQERGEQYQRAIQLYTSKIRRYPQSIDDLEKTNGIRFLRKRFKDPFTGKDDWRIIHVNATGQLTDSLVKKQQTEEKKNQNTFITENTGIGQTETAFGQTGVNVALRKRPSEGGTGADGAPLPLPSTGPPAFDPNTGAPPNPQQNQVPNPLVNPQQMQLPNGQQAINPATGLPQAVAVGQGLNPGQIAINPATGQPYPPGQVPPGMTVQQAYPNGVPQYAGQAPVAINPATGQPYAQPQPGQIQPGQMQPGQMQPGQIQPGQMQQGQFQPAQPGPGFQPPLPGGFNPQQQTYPTNAAVQPGQPGGTTPTAALDMIRQALTSPSPNIPMNMGPGVQLGGGIAGVASKYEGPSIKIYAEQQEYQKWEFIYDPKNDKRLKQQLGQAGVNAGMNNQPNPAGLNNGINNGMNNGFNNGPNNGFNNGLNNNGLNNNGLNNNGFNNGLNNRPGSNPGVTQPINSFPGGQQGFPQQPRR